MPEMKYIGKGKWLRGVPKRDLSSEDVERCGGVVALEETGLYKRLIKEQPKKIEVEVGEVNNDGRTNRSKKATPNTDRSGDDPRDSG
jgi:hypothetical protein